MSWFRNRQTGDRGKLEIRDGEKVVVLDRPAADHVVPYSEAQWREETEPKKYSMMELGQIAWAADRELLRVLGDHGRAGKKWGELSEAQRNRWIVKGPIEHQSRRDLFDAIMNVLRPMGSAA